MSWRVVVVSSRAKLELKLNYLVIRNNAEIKKIHIDEISVLTDSNAVVAAETAIPLCDIVSPKAMAINKP